MHPADYRLATAEITYYLPDYPHLVQTYIWQDLDLPPQFPELRDFLDFWKKNLEGRLRSVYVASSGLLVPRFRSAKFSMHIH
ncbi:Usg family protein [Candidatus Kaiserbacteria bacterium RIFCSPLOWO2_01_FULL_53_17]|uniref:Usg family protein n=1 Tax=Candidatus Kaiserbacteria bacterium RIFCSPLOWO2_01_FULL_53_17 TaxID=1798511 RepID=A0A1F6EGL2_9BACT|nr:MAG: Usg family protein [Candidatus Kaiserbacteria bacterium RIFCSPLOWO2_01_FULL_53_17]